MNSLARWFSESLFPIVKAGGIAVANTLIQALAGLVSLLASMLPSWNPYELINLNFDSGILSWLNWLFPISTAVSLLSGYVSILGTILVAKVIMRWIKAL